MRVQAVAIPYVLRGDDLIVQSRTGSGKTGAFLLPLFATLDVVMPRVQALILTPTRELARQIFGEFERMAAQSGFKGALVYGGVGYGAQIKSLKEGAQILVGTPGRILDLLGRRTFTLDAMKVLILDEADEMLSMGFLPDMQRLAEYVPTPRHSYMFSATMPPKVRALGRLFLQNPSFLGLSADNISVDTLKHSYCRTGTEGKTAALIRLLEYDNPRSALVFANTRSEVTFVAKLLARRGFSVARIAGDMPQNRREDAMRRLRQGTLRILVATDVAARGIDISELSHVMQYDVPQHTEMYIHRTGRTARAGQAGVAITLTTFEDEVALKAIARYYALDMENRPLPTEEETTERVQSRATVTLASTLRSKSPQERERMARFVPLVTSLAEEEPELLAMLVDDLYQRKVYGTRQNRRSRPKRRKRPDRHKGDKSGGKQ